MRHAVRRRRWGAAEFLASGASRERRQLRGTLERGAEKNWNHKTRMKRTNPLACAAGGVRDG
ncbi:hypothetical protein E2C01_089002 [Portunus trituberculatus]|uniref:Uncharacterized protein n=1 Tax=Portunus trituberculatus TaxID=210409 RepID=A0A5B7JL26_PORTR|nr:hypothetical protein [Portunus trituberculatus]